MAKGRRASTRARYRGKRRKGFVAINFNASLGLAGLADNTVTTVTLLDAALGEDLYVLSIDASWAILNGIDGEGPIAVGFAHSDLIGTEILEALEVELTDPDDIIARERSRRPVRRAGMFREAGTGHLAEVLNGGNLIRTKMRFSVGDGHNLDAWALNRGNANLSGGSQTLEIEGTIFGRWQR